MKKRMIAAILSIALLISMAPVTVLAAETVDSGYCGFYWSGVAHKSVTWTLDAEGTLTISGAGEMENYGKDPVYTYLWNDAPWYEHRFDILSVVVEQGVTSIGDYAFQDCENLTNVTLPDGVTGIGEGAFASCFNLTDITIPDSAASIGMSAFQGCNSLPSITIPDGVTMIGVSTFAGCISMTDITIPASVTSIGMRAFYKCSSLSDVYYGGSREEWEAISIGNSYNGALTDATIHYNSIDIADDPIKKEWVKQHMEYAASAEYKAEVLGGYHGSMLETFDDIIEDNGIKFYDFTNALVETANGKRKVSQAELYELLLAELMYASLNEDMAYELYEENYYLAVADVLDTLIQGASATAGLVVDNTALKSMQDLVKILKTMNKNSPGFQDTVEEITSQVKANFTKDELCKALNGGAAVMGISILADGAMEGLNTISDVLEYSYNSVAYAYTSDEFEEVMNALADKVTNEFGPGNFPLLYTYDQEINWEEFAAALRSFTASLEACKKDRAAEVGRYAAERTGEGVDNFALGAMKSIAVYGVQTIISCIPVLGQIQNAIAVLSVGLSAVELLTDVDEQSYRLDMLTKLYCISVALDSVIEDFGSVLSEDNYWEASIFDESISLYKTTQLMAVEYMVEYENSLLGNAYAAAFSQGAFSNPNLSTRIAVYENRLRSLEGKRVEIQNIICHDSLLFSGSASDQVSSTYRDASIYFIACPVSVTVLSETGEQIAYLSNDVCEVAEGHELYFHTVELDENESAKVAFIPEGYQVLIDGESTGTMDVFVKDAQDQLQYFLDVPVTADTKGYFVDSADDPETKNLVVDDTTYVAETVESQLGDANNDGSITNVDAMLILQYFVGLIDETAVNLSACDVNGDGAVTNVDAMLVLQYFVGLITEF